MLRAATRGSPLALWQTRRVAELLGVELELVVVETVADRRQDVPIHQMGGKGVFVKEVQQAVLDGRADLAVHSVKDMPAISPEGLVLAAVPERGEVRDALVGARLAELPEGAEVATGSARRRVQLAAARPDLRFLELRGNIGTRLAKAAHHDAIVMALVAIERLGEAPAVVDPLPSDVMVPQVGQGALGVECRPELVDAVAGIEHTPSRRVVDAERAFLAELGGDCDLPAGAHAVLAPDGAIVTVTGVLADPEVRRVVASGPDGPAVGAEVARRLRR